MPEGLKSGRVEGTDEHEEQDIEAHHDGKMMSDEPRPPLSMSGIRTEHQFIQQDNLVNRKQ